MGRKAALHNLGCKVNAYEAEAMRQMLEKAGYEIVPFAPGADVYVINTCTVTGTGGAIVSAKVYYSPDHSPGSAGTASLSASSRYFRTSACSISEAISPASLRVWET